MAGALEVLALNLRRSALEAEAKTKLMMYSAGLDAVGYARALVPVDSGDLYRSIGVRYTDNMHGFDLEATEDYASYVEYGTTQEDGSPKMAPQPYLGPAMDRVIGEVTAKLRVIGVTSMP